MTPPTRYLMSVIFGAAVISTIDLSRLRSGAYTTDSW
jgi:hypothetical protein